MMNSERMVFAGIFGLALAACASPSASPDEHAERIGTTAQKLMECSCDGQSGTWTGEYGSSEDTAYDIGRYCAHGGGTGSCTPIPGSGSSTSSGYTDPGQGGSGAGTGAGSGSIPGAGSGSGSTIPGAGAPGSGGGGTPPNSSNVPRDGVFRQTVDYWNTFYTYHHEQSEAGFNDGDSVRFFQQMVEAKSYQDFSAFSFAIPLSYKASLVVWAFGTLDAMQINGIASKYEQTGGDQGIRVVLDITTDQMSGRIENYLIYNISDGALLGQISIASPVLANNTDNGRCQFGTYGDVALAETSCSNGFTACNTGYNCN